MGVGRGRLVAAAVGTRVRLALNSDGPRVGDLESTAVTTLVGRLLGGFLSTLNTSAADGARLG